MSTTRITIENDLGHNPNRPDFTVTPQAVYQLFKHGWEPPAGSSYRGHTPDGQVLLIPSRTIQSTATPTVEQLETIILARIQARLNLSQGQDTAGAVVKAAGDAAEAIHDMLHPMP